MRTAAAVKRCAIGIRRIVSTFKFRGVAIGVALTTIATSLTMLFVLNVTERQMQRLLYEQKVEGIQRTAQLVSSKLNTLQRALRAAADDLPPHSIGDAPAMRRFISDRSALTILFDALFIADSRGNVVAFIDRNGAQTYTARLNDRDYFIRSIASGAPVISKPLIANSSHEPVVVFTMPIRDNDGAVVGLMAGSIRLLSNHLLGDVTAASGYGAESIIVTDNQGRIIGHQDPDRIMGNAGDEPGLGEAFARWSGGDRVVPVEGVIEQDARHLVAIAGIPSAEWLISSTTDRNAVFAPIQAGRDAARRAGLLAAFCSALVTAAVMIWFTRPIRALNLRANQVLSDRNRVEGDWPEGHHEVGELSRVLQQVLRERNAVEVATNELLTRLQAVLDNASVGIAFTRHHRFELVSRTFSDMFGYAASEVIREPMQMIVAADDDYQQVDQAASQAFANGKTVSLELRCRRKIDSKQAADSVFWARLVGRAIDPTNLDTGAIWIIEDVTESHESREQLAWVAGHDSLTGLINRREFEAQLARRIDGTPFTLMFIDLDRFKEVNDSCGHGAGDKLLCDLSRAIESCVRPGDTVARFGGDEFSLVLNECGFEPAQRVANDIRVAVEQYQLIWDGRICRVGASIGLVIVEGGGHTIPQIMRAADEACYAAKRAGRNRICLSYVGPGRGAGPGSAPQLVQTA